MITGRPKPQDYSTLTQNEKWTFLSILSEGQEKGSCIHLELLPYPSNSFYSLCGRVGEASSLLGLSSRIAERALVILQFCETIPKNYIISKTEQNKIKPKKKIHNL